MHIFIFVCIPWQMIHSRVSWLRRRLTGRSRQRSTTVMCTSFPVDIKLSRACDFFRSLIQITRLALMLVNTVLFGRGSTL